MVAVRSHVVTVLLFATLLWWALLLYALASLIGWLPAALAMGALIVLAAVAAGCVMREPKGTPEQRKGQKG